MSSEGQIKLEFYDDGATTEGAVKGVSYLIDNCHVDGIIGSQLSGNIESTGDLVEASEVPEVATGMNPAWLEKDGPICSALYQTPQEVPNPW